MVCSREGPWRQSRGSASQLRVGCVAAPSGAALSHPLARGVTRASTFPPRSAAGSLRLMVSLVWVSFSLCVAWCVGAGCFLPRSQPVFFFFSFLFSPLLLVSHHSHPVLWLFGSLLALVAPFWSFVSSVLACFVCGVRANPGNNPPARSSRAVGIRPGHNDAGRGSFAAPIPHHRLSDRALRLLLCDCCSGAGGDIVVPEWGEW